MQIMCDIEMLAPIPGGQLLQLSAVSFDFAFKPQEAMEILSNPDRFINIAFAYYGGHVSPETMAFWELPEQRAAFELIDKMPKVSRREGLEKFSTFVRSFLGSRASIWAKPPLFDLLVLRDAYNAEFVESELDPTPWAKKQESCLRTMMWLADRVPREKFRVPDMTSQGLVKHYALHDCVQQVIVAQSAYRALLEQARAR